MKFQLLVNTIQQTHTALYQSAIKAVNSPLTLRNWLIGFYIVEYEQKGEDRAKYGKRLLEKLSGKIRIKGLAPPELSRCRQFYFCYTQILGSVTQESSVDEPGYYLQLFQKISFTHFTELIKINDPLKRRYYELLTVKQTLSVRELKRQINTLSFERLGLSANKTKARQKRILIGDEYFFIDMVLYHRILQCHVLTDLKVDSFNHSHAAQLNACLKYYNKQVRTGKDNPPIGILLVTDKNKTLGEYASEGIDEKMFVSKYAVQLPGKKKLQNFINNELKKL